MNINVPPGRYVVAVSGGVDSMSLLHALKSLPDVQLVVAHFDHGIRPDSKEDKKFVEQVAADYDLPFEAASGLLGPDASEAQARERRYEFLEAIRELHNASAIITAHHADDVLETAILNMLRGTGRKGLSSLGSHDKLIRPLTGTTKADILAYATEHGIRWREDSTNADTRYARNYIRQHILPRFTGEQKQRLLEIIGNVRQTNHELDEALEQLLKAQADGNHLSRAYVIQLPHKIAAEVVAAWLRRHGIREFDRKIIERIVVAAKAGRPGTLVPVYGPHQIHLSRTELRLGERLPLKKQG
jgi:tRNA(Ile)-lysidine synthetase-like protein